MSVHDLQRSVTARHATRADAICFRLFRERIAGWEMSLNASKSAPATVFEHASRIVAFSRARLAAIEAPDWSAHPLPVLSDPIVEGSHRALIGCGLWLADDTSPGVVDGVHELARALHADELGARYVVVHAPVPPVPPFDAAGVVQQIVDGSIEWPPVSRPVRHGYWPVAVTPEGGTVLVREQRAF